jgi:hypothetical protein
MDGSRIAWCSGPTVRTGVCTSDGITPDHLIDIDCPTFSVFIAGPTLGIGAELGLVTIDLNQ